MIKWTKKEIIIIGSIGVSIFVVPIIIHMCYSIDSLKVFFKAKWESGDVLQYSGAIITALVAIAGVYVSLKESRINNLENKILEYRPHLNSTFIHITSFVELEKLKVNNNIVCVWTNDATFSYNLNNLHGKLELEELNDKQNIQDNFFILVYDVENIGLGHALNFEFSINGHIFFPKKIICKGERKRIYILISREVISKEGICLNFNLEYQDIIDINTYSQSERLNIIYNEEENRFLYHRGFEHELSEPVIINKKILK